MDYRIEIGVRPEWHDARGEAALKKMTDFLNGAEASIRTRDVFTVSAELTDDQAEKIACELANPVLQYHKVGETRPGEIFDFDWIVAVGFRPGVTDNVGQQSETKDLLHVPGDDHGRRRERQRRIDQPRGAETRHVDLGRLGLRRQYAADERECAEDGREDHVNDRYESAVLEILDVRLKVYDRYDAERHRREDPRGKHDKRSGTREFQASGAGHLGLLPGFFFDDFVFDFVHFSCSPILSLITGARAPR